MPAQRLPGRVPIFLPPAVARSRDTLLVLSHGEEEEEEEGRGDWRDRYPGKGSRDTVYRFVLILREDDGWNETNRYGGCDFVWIFVYRIIYRVSFRNWKRLLIVCT